MSGIHRAVRVFLLSGLLANPAALSLHGQAAAPEPVLVNLRLGRIAERTVDAYRAGDEALLPVRALFELAELRIEHQADGDLEGMLQPGNLPFAFDSAGRRLQVGRDRWKVPADQLVFVGDEVFIGSQTLQLALGFEWAISWPELEVTLRDPSTLPIARRLRREALLASRLPGGGEAEPHAVRYGLPRSGVQGLVVDYSVLAPAAGLEATAYATSLGLDVFGGAFAMGVQSQGPGEGPRADASWTGNWRRSRWVTQATIGDGFATGPRSRNLRGVSFTNSPYVRPANFGIIPFAGQLGTGWSVEAYRGGRLIAFDSVNALGQFSFDLPVQYGENPVDFIAYGPFGEVREFNQAYRVRQEIIPARRFEYGLSAGACRTDRCDATANVDLRYGISSRWSARAGLDQFWRDSLEQLTHPYVGISGTLSNALTVEAGAVGNALLASAVRIEPSIDLQLQFEAARFIGDATQPILTAEGRQHQFTFYGFWRPVPRLGATYLEASVDRIGTNTGSVNSGRLGISSQWSGIRVIPSVRVQQQDPGAGPTLYQTFYSISTYMLPRPELPGLLGGLTARSSVEFEAGQGMSQAFGYVGLPLLHGLRAETGVTWNQFGGANFSLLIAAELPSVRSYTTVTAGPGPVTGSQYLTGSAIYNPSRNGVDFAATPAQQRGGLTGRVFLDRNGDGSYQEGEPLIPEVRVVIGRGFGVTDEHGRYRFWDLIPFEPTPVHVDSATLPSPLWIPTFAMAAVELSPNRYRQLDIPVVAGGVVEGLVRWADGSRSPHASRTAGIVLQAVHRETGEVRTLTTFSDGSFYAIGLRPGEWTLSVEGECLKFLEARTEPIQFTIRPDEAGDSVGGLSLTLE